MATIAEPPTVPFGTDLRTFSCSYCKVLKNEYAGDLLNKLRVGTEPCKRLPPPSIVQTKAEWYQPTGVPGGSDPLQIH